MREAPLDRGLALDLIAARLFELHSSTSSSPCVRCSMPMNLLRARPTRISSSRLEGWLRSRDSGRSET
jgi:hypothetical protein